MKRKFLALTFLLVAALVLIACPPPVVDPEVEVDEPILIGGAIMNLAWPWFLGTIEGMEAYAEEHDLNVEFHFEDGRFDIPTQIAQLETMAAKGAEGIVVFPVDGSAIIPTMVRLHNEKGITFVVGDFPQTVDDPADKVWATFVGHDFREMGRVAGQIAVDYFKAIGKYDPIAVWLTLPAAGQSSIDRHEGFREVFLGALPDAKVIEAPDTGAGDRATAHAVMEAVLHVEDVIDVVAGHNDALVVGAYNAARGVGRRVIERY